MLTVVLVTYQPLLPAVPEATLADPVGLVVSSKVEAFTALVVIRNAAPGVETTFAGMDADAAGDPAEKAQVLLTGSVKAAARRTVYSTTWGQYS